MMKLLLTTCISMIIGLFLYRYSQLEYNKITELAVITMSFFIGIAIVIAEEHINQTK